LGLTSELAHVWRAIKKFARHIQLEVVKDGDYRLSPISPTLRTAFGYLVRNGIALQR
jgi:hypothetical protein